MVYKWKDLHRFADYIRLTAITYQSFGLDSAPNKKQASEEVCFLFGAESNPKDWYVITLQRVCNCRRRMASPKVYTQSFVSITYISTKWLHSVLRRITYTATP